MNVRTLPAVSHLLFLEVGGLRSAPSALGELGGLLRHGVEETPGHSGLMRRLRPKFGLDPRVRNPFLEFVEGALPTRAGMFLCQIPCLLLSPTLFAGPFRKHSMCGRAGVFGHHCGAQFGFLFVGVSQWRAWMPVCVERVECEDRHQCHGSDMDVARPNPGDSRRIKVVGDELALFGGVQLAIDTTLVSLLHEDGTVCPGCTTTDFDWWC